MTTLPIDSDLARLLDLVDVPPLPAGFADRVVARALAQSGGWQRSAERRGRRWARGAVALGAAAALVATAAAGGLFGERVRIPLITPLVDMFIGPAPRPAPAGPPPADLPVPPAADGVAPAAESAPPPGQRLDEPVKPSASPYPKPEPQSPPLPGPIPSLASQPAPVLPRERPPLPVLAEPPLRQPLPVAQPDPVADRAAGNEVTPPIEADGGTVLPTRRVGIETGEADAAQPLSRQRTVVPALPQRVDTTRPSPPVERPALPVRMPPPVLAPQRNPPAPSPPPPRRQPPPPQRTGGR